MRVLALVTDAFGGYGGIAQFNRDLLSALAQSSRVSEVVVMPRLASPDPVSLPQKVRQLAPQKSRSLYVASSFRAAKICGPFDAVFSGHLYHMPLAVGLGRWLKKPVWLQTHGIDAWERPNSVVRFAAEESALITTVSRYTKRKLLTWANIEPERVRVLPNTYRSMFIRRPQSPVILDQLDLADRKIILTVSRLSKADVYKGHSKILGVLPKVIQHYPEAVYLIVGDGDAKSDLERDVANRGLASAVRFLGRLEDDKILQLYRTANVFAMPSNKEGFGIVFIEAAATGLPVIGGSRDGSADALADGVIGTMIDPDDSDALARALLAALSGSMKAGTTAVQRFAFENFARHVDDLIQRFAR